MSVNETRVEMVEVPGARLHCEITGSGPVALLIPGAPADAAIFGFLATLLADRYTVVTYDLRGLSRSELTDEAEAGQDQQVGQLADDAYAVLKTFADGPAYVLGCSGGALVGLELVARHPEAVRTLVAHEPPVMELLPERDEWRAFYEQLHATYETAGADAAMGLFIGAVEGHVGPGRIDGVEPPAAPPMPDFSQMPPEMVAMMGRMQANVAFFFGRQLRTVTRFVPDFEALTAGSATVVVGAGGSSKGQPAHNAAEAVAAGLGRSTVEFPGDHQGFATHTVEFAEALDRAFRGA